MAPSISKRHYLRWLPDPVPDQDNTSTIVTTSDQNRFVDLRVFKESQSGEVVLRGKSLDSPQISLACADNFVVQPLSQLEWGLAGTSSSEPKKGPKGEDISHGVWKHWIDSRSPDAEGVQDEGDNYPLPNGEVLELGSMMNPDTGKVTDYEEKWADVAPKSIGRKDGKVECVVLQLHDDSHKARGLVVRAGQYCQGIIRVGDAVAVERWAWDEETQFTWKRRVRMGDLFLPCGVAMEPAKLELGGKVTLGEQEWTVIELTET